MVWPPDPIPENAREHAAHIIKVCETDGGLEMKGVTPDDLVGGTRAGERKEPQREAADTASK
jgi:hypothetical protein